MATIGIYPGSFDPITNGHLDVMIRASKIVDTLIVAVLKNPSKKGLFSIDERVEQLLECTKDIPNIIIEQFEGLLMDFAKQKNAKVVIRGLRAVTDFEYEFQWALANRSLAPEIETIFLTTSTDCLFLSSSAVKEIASFKGNVDEMVPPYVASKLKEKYI